MWNVLVQYHLILRQQLYLKYDLHTNKSPMDLKPETEFNKIAVIKDFMESSRVKQLNYLCESIMLTTLPKLN